MSAREPISPSPTAAELTPTAGPIWLQVGRLFCGVDTSVVTDGHLVYDAGGICYAGTEAPPAHVVRAGQVAPDFCLPTFTALPGLTDAHTHLFLDGGELDPSVRADYLKQSPSEHLAQAEARLARLVAIGVTAVREAGDRGEVGLALQARWRSTDRGVMPYVDAPGAAIHHAGRYGSFMAEPMEDHASPAATVAARIAAGGHRIKLLATGIINFEKGAVTAKPQMPVEELTALVEASRERGKSTMVHCSGHDGVANCIAAGVDTIEHGFFVDDEQLARMRDRDVVWVPTFAPVQFQVDRPEILGWSETVQGNLRRILDAHARSLVKAVELGVRVVAGSDAGSHGVPHGWGFLRELELMQWAGLSAATVLHSATGAGGARMHYAETFGVLRTGAAARFILTEHDVLDSVANLQRDKIVVFDGRVITAGDDADQPGL